MVVLLLGNYHIDLELCYGEAELPLFIYEVVTTSKYWGGSIGFNFEVWVVNVVGDSNPTSSDDIGKLF